MININESLCFTGHRPQKLTGFKASDNKELLLALKDMIVDHIENKGVTTFISGMALGIDIWSARIVIALRESKYPHIKLVSAIPCANQYSIWKDQKVVDEWNYIVENADVVHYVSDEPYTAWCLQKRNEWMVDNSSHIISVWDGTAGGTSNCIKYAHKHNKKVLNLNPKTLEKSYI